MPTTNKAPRLGPACFLWDFLRRSGSAGYFLPLSGGIDSCATAVIVFSMCRQVLKAIGEKSMLFYECLRSILIVFQDEQVFKDVRRLSGEPEDSEWLPSTPQELCG
jgi:NAD+ synthase (glutamine-hydrolysing)